MRAQTKQHPPYHPNPSPPAPHTKHPPTTRRRTGDGYPDVRREQSPPAYHTSCCSILWWHLHRKSAELQSPRPLQWFGQFADAGATHARSSTLTTRKRIETAVTVNYERLSKIIPFSKIDKSTSDMSSADEFQSGGAGASATEPIRAGEVKKGMTVMLKDKPCKVREQS